MTALSTRSEGAAANERELLVSQCAVTRPGALSGPIDPATGVETPGVATAIYAGPCWLKMPSQATSATVGGDVVIVQSPMLALSVDAPVLKVGDLATITASPVAVNVGRKARVKSLYGGDFVTLARYDVEVITG